MIWVRYWERRKGETGSPPAAFQTTGPAADPSTWLFGRNLMVSGHELCEVEGQEDPDQEG